MKVLIACEESQRVCIEFRKRGHKAMFKHIFKGMTWENRGGFGTTGD